MSACQSTSPIKPVRPENPRQNAADLVLAAATASAPRAAKLRLQASEVYVENGRPDLAAPILSALDDKLLYPDERARYRRTFARVLITLRDYAGADRLLTSGPIQSWEDYSLIAQACAGLENHSCAADGWIQASLELGLDAGELPDDLHDRIWQHLSAARTGPKVFSHRYHHAWWTLQQVVREAGSITAQRAAWQSWQARHPSHPAKIRPPRVLDRLTNYQPPSMAVMLPLSGDLGDAGQAVRDGFIAAYLGEPTAQRPSVRFYDTGLENIGSVWEKILTGGHDVAVGPLIKPNVDRFAQISVADELPRLSLNYLTHPDDNPGDLFQLGVAIEDEARSLVTHMLLAGHRQIMILHSEAAWSRRAAATFAAQWPFPVTVRAFDNIKGLTEAVGNAMLTEESEQRRNKIQRLIGQPVEFLPRARKDLDAIFALTSNVESQALVPALKFHFGDHLPVYATSQASRQGKVDALSGFRLTELPILATDEFDQLKASFPIVEGNFTELYALGYDAYRVGTWLPLIETESHISIPGASGYLWLEGDGTFRRELDLMVLDPN